MKDTTQVLTANGAAIGLSFTEMANVYLTTVSLILAIGFTIYKFYKEVKK